jgi:formate hydrogenlyase transcriptional activator
MQVPPFILAELMMGAIILAAALFHLVLAWNGVRRRLNLTFVLLAVFVAGEAFAAPLRYLSPSVSDLVLGLKLSQGCIVAYAAALVWFTREYAGFKQTRIPTAITAYIGLVLVLHLTQPYSLLFESISGVQTAPLPGGGIMYIAQGQPNPWLYLGNLVGILTISYVLAGCWRLWRQRELREEAISFSVGIAPLVFFAYPHGVLVNRGLLQPPIYYTFGFLGLVAIMSFDILRNTMRSLALSREVRSNERRWRSLLENVSLMVLVCDRQGRIEYANPFLLRTAEYELSELIGKPFDLLFPPAELAGLQRLFEAGMGGNVSKQIQTGLLTRSKEQRSVLWSNVLLYGKDDELVGVLSVGNDLTERVSAEKARDEAMEQLAALKTQLESENQYLRLEYEGSVDSADFVGKSDAIRYVLRKIGQVASTNATVLIEGDTGVGKELVARAIHKGSPRAQMPFVRVNCAALPSNLIESELFGHERGAFTGADRAKLGRFELAEGGTLLLDEIGGLALDVQAKLLRVLQEGEYDRVGGTKTRKADVRVIASTNRNLRQDVAAGRFREDLYYRLQVFPISVPPLKERREDIPLLVHYFVHRLSQKHGRPVREVPMRVIRQLSEREWPGNVRELENVIERAIITSSGLVLSMPDEVVAGDSKPAAGNGNGSLTLDDVERRHIEQILKQTKGQIAGEGGAAEILGLHPNTLRGRMSKLGVNRPR